MSAMEELWFHFFHSLMCWCSMFSLSCIKRAMFSTATVCLSMSLVCSFKTSVWTLTAPNSKSKNAKDIITAKIDSMYIFRICCIVCFFWVFFIVLVVKSRMALF